jgi:predicted secreted protein
MRKVVGLLAALGLSLALAGPALAAKPNNQACLGHDVSGYAAGGADFGAFVSGGANSTQGIGAEVQAHLAGQIPDAELANTCND